MVALGSHGESLFQIVGVLLTKVERLFQHKFGLIPAHTRLFRKPILFSKVVTGQSNVDKVHSLYSEHLVLTPP